MYNTQRLLLYENDRGKLNESPDSCLSDRVEATTKKIVFNQETKSFGRLKGIIYKLRSEIAQKRCKIIFKSTFCFCCTVLRKILCNFYIKSHKIERRFQEQSKNDLIQILMKGVLPRASQTVSSLFALANTSVSRIIYNPFPRVR